MLTLFETKWDKPILGDKMPLKSNCPDWSTLFVEVGKLSSKS